MDIIDKIFGIIAPHTCLSCGEEGDLVCESCFSAEMVSVPSNCIGCKKLVRNFKTCDKCRPKFPLEAVWIAHDYNPLARSLISAYKYNSQRSASSILKSSMLEILPEFEFVVTSVPTSPGRIRQRGFDHASRIAKQISLKRRLPYYNLLLRLKDTHQVGAGREKRFKQVQGLFAVKKNTNIKGRDILLVDDVVTTGASLSAAARELKKAGAKNVYGLVFARKI